MSARSAFGLITAVGEDRAGAIRFVAPSRVEEVPADGVGQVQWLEESEIERRLQTLRSDAAAWRELHDTGHFSLAGAQPKTGLLHDGTRWGVPSGRTPTTHILKPGTLGLDGHAENEHFCLVLARSLGLPAASSKVGRFGSEVAIVVERCDRLRTDAGIQRVHQEDTCQALGIPPSRKYENEGGPGAAAVVSILRQHSRAPEEDVATFVDALVYNWLIAGTNGHAKNYSFLLGAGGKVRLAPLYDVASVLPYEAMRLQKVKLAMKLGGVYRLRDTGLHAWRKLAGELELDETTVVDRVGRMAASMPDTASAVAKRERENGLNHPVVDRLVERLQERSLRCAKALLYDTSTC